VLVLLAADVVLVLEDAAPMTSVWSMPRARPVAIVRSQLAWCA
jgi:hypothetical protein